MFIVQHDYILVHLVTTSSPILLLRLRLFCYYIIFNYVTSSSSILLPRFRIFCYTSPSILLPRFWLFCYYSTVYSVTSSTVLFLHSVSTSLSIRYYHNALVSPSYSSPVSYPVFYFSFPAFYHYLTFWIYVYLFSQNILSLTLRMIFLSTLGWIIFI